MDFISFLSTLIGNFDFTVLNFLHSFADYTKGAFTPLMSFISLIGEKGILVFILGTVLFIFKRTRKLGFAILIAFVATAVLNNFILKNVFERARPFCDTESLYFAFWQFVGAPNETGFSFPSGHTSAAMAGMTVLFLFGNKKYSWTAFFYPLIMGVSRCYFCVHYPSDILMSFAVGAITGIGAYYLTNFIFRNLNVNSENFLKSHLKQKLANRKNGAV